MAGKSARDKCFEEAVDAFNDTQPDEGKIKIESQKPWTIDATTGKWRPMGLGERFWDWVMNKDVPYRVPDWTLDVDGKPVAGDNKFDGDKFNESRKSPRTKNTQREDQNKMNEDNNPDKDEYQDLGLDSKNCKCDGDPKPQEVYEFAPGRVYVPGFSVIGEPPPLSSLVPEGFGSPGMGGFRPLIPRFVWP